MASTNPDSRSTGRARRAAHAVAAPARAADKALLRPTRSPGQAAGQPGQVSDGSAVVDCGLYVDGHRRPGVDDYTQALAEARREAEGAAFVWLGLHEPTFEEFADIAATFDLHPLAVEDAVHAHQRPKVDRYGSTTFLVVKTAHYVAHREGTRDSTGELTGSSDIIETGEVMAFVGPDFLVTVRHGDAGRLAPVRAALAEHADLLRHGPWAVTYAILDRIVDQYLLVVDEVEDDIDEVESGVFAARAYGDVQRVYQLKRELLEMRRAVVPLVRPLGMLTSGGVHSVPMAVRNYFGDVEDHLTRVTEQVHAFDELLNGLVQANLARVGIQQNNDMRKISAWVAIAAVPTMIAGIYGMNFHHMPELHWAFGYPLCLLVMLTICVGLYRAFRHSGWL